MSMPTEAVMALHDLTTELREEHVRRSIWLDDYDKRDGGDGTNGEIPLVVTRAEAERIFADRIAAHESRLKALGWSRVIRVDDPSNDPAKS